MSANDAAATSDADAIEIESDRVAAWLADGEAGPQVVDVREQYEHDAGHIAGSRHVPLVELSGQAATIDRDRPIVFYCRVGSRSDMAAQAFRASGFQAYSMQGGLVRWTAENRPLEPEDGYVAEH